MKRTLIHLSLLVSLLLSLAVTAGASSSPAALNKSSASSSSSAAPNGPPASNSLQAAPNEPAATCTTPYTETIRDKQVQWDQCYLREFNHGGTDYAVRVYYTEAFNADPADFNYSQCNPDDEDPNVRCEHALPNIDNGNGDNQRAVTLGTEAETALRFYIDHNMSPMPGNDTDFYVYIAEDPKNGWIVEPDGIITDDETAATTDVLSVRWNVFHEMQHLIQKENVNGNWVFFWTEGLARAIEDRVDVALDNALKAFITDSRRMLRNEPDNGFPRSSDLLDTSYRGVVWWTWVLDQYKENSEAAPALGWLALQDFYDEIATGSDALTAVDDFLKGKGSSFHKDFIDYTLAMYAYKYSPWDPRLGFLDTEFINEVDLQNHTEIDAPPANPGQVFTWLQPRSSKYWEFTDAGSCDYVSFDFNGGTKNFAFSVLTVDNNTLNARWTMYTSDWAWAGRSTDLERVAGVVASTGSQGFVAVTYDCVEPTVTILNPTTSAFKMVGTASNPRQFIVELEVVTGDGTPVKGLVPSAFQVEIKKGADPAIEADIVNALYVQSKYWLLVQAPDEADGAQTGNFYNLTVNLDSYDADTQNNALLYVEQVLDKVLVLDRSGSMADNGKLGAAKNAANLMVAELSDDDQGGYVAFDEDAYLRQALKGMDTTNHRTNLESSIAAETAGGQTSIGDGLKLAAQQHDSKGIADNACSFVLLSDGYENEADYWADVEAGVVDNGCGLNVVALGPEANEDLLQEIAGAGSGGGGALATNAILSANSAGGGSYNYAPDSGSVSFDSATGANSIGWDNNLSRIYDYQATVDAGRQRIYSTVGSTALHAGPAYGLRIDKTTDLLVVAIAWQTPNTFSPSRLFEPDDDEVSASLKRLSPQWTNEVWRVPNPEPGTYELQILGLPGEYYISASARTNLQLHLFTGAAVPDAYPGMKVPILTSFVNKGAPALDATVWAQVVAPNGTSKTVMLYDDGAHGDTLPGDGVYGNWHTVTSIGELVAQDPQGYDEGDEPSSSGSYQVNAVGKWMGHTREAQGSFLLQKAKDSDGDGLPDPYEDDNGLDPNDPGDSSKDQDGDGLVARCEFILGTDPWNSDTDNGGEHDGSEVPGCIPGTQDPLDPDDDRIGSIAGLLVRPEATSGGDLSVLLNPVGHGPWMTDVIIYRAESSDGEVDGSDFIHWQRGTGSPVVDTGVEAGKYYSYRWIPIGSGRDGRPHEGAVVRSATVLAKSDPYAPEGSIIIDDGALSTSRRTVKLSIIADDLSPDHGDGGGDKPGDSSSQLMMRLSPDGKFGSQTWEPYKPVVEGWELTGAVPGQEAMVYLQLKDTSGNVGISGLGMADGILYQPNVVYLPLVLRAK